MIQVSRYSVFKAFIAVSSAVDVLGQSNTLTPNTPALLRLIVCHVTQKSFSFSPNLFRASPHCTASCCCCCCACYVDRWYVISLRDLGPIHQVHYFVWVPLQFRTDGSVFNPMGLQFAGKDQSSVSDYSRTVTFRWLCITGSNRT